MHQTEGNVWRALGIMVAAGALRNAALLLRELRMPDAAAAFCAACKEAGFHSPLAPSDAGQPVGRPHNFKFPATWGC